MTVTIINGPVGTVIFNGKPSRNSSPHFHDAGDENPSTGREDAESGESTNGSEDEEIPEGFEGLDWEKIIPSIDESGADDSVSDH
jgi:hypothetical protein